MHIEKGGKYSQSVDFMGWIQRSQKERTAPPPYLNRDHSYRQTTDLDGHYRDFGHYVIDYLEVQDAKYNTDKEEAINCMAQMQRGQGRRIAQNWGRKYGKKDIDTGYRKMKEALLWRYGAVCLKSRNARIQALSIQRRIIRGDDFRLIFGEA